MRLKIRQGRRNLLEMTSENVVQKTGIKQERIRPHRLMIEAWALRQAKMKGINVPYVIDYYRNSDDLEVMNIERIYGKSLSRQISKENINCMHSVGAQMTLLSEASTGFGWINPVSKTGTSNSWRSFLLKYVSWSEKRLVEMEVLQIDHLYKVYDVIENADFDILKPYLVHRDIKPSNIIKDHNGKAWIIDWENVMLGDPIYDIAMFGVKYGHGALWQGLKDGYGLKFSSEKYALYETIGLIGIIDFYQENNIPYEGRKYQLIKLISKIKSVTS